MKSIKNYPVTDSGDTEWVKHPVEITSDFAKRHQSKVISKLVVGKFICVDVLLPKGFMVSPLAACIDTKELAIKACKAHNSWAGYTPLQVDKIISMSMGLPVPTRKPTA